MTFAGALCYQAPELTDLNKKKLATLSSQDYTKVLGVIDSWSLGLVILELCMGMTPLATQDPKTYLKQEMDDVPDGEVKTVMKKLLVIKPEDRVYLHEAVSK